MLQNNSATTFTHVRGKGRVLLIEDWENPGEFETLVQRLGEKNIEVEVMPSDRLFTSLAELQGFDCVVLANVPRASGGEIGQQGGDEFQRRADRDARPQHRAVRLRPGDDRRAATASAPAAGPTPSWKRRCRSISRSRTPR